MTARQEDGTSEPPKGILRSKHDETPEAYGRRLADFLYERAARPKDSADTTRSRDKTGNC